MWKIYARQTAGVAVKTDFASLSESIADEQVVYIGRVHYIDYDLELVPERNTMGRLLYKRNHFQHEREFQGHFGHAHLRPTDYEDGYRLVRIDISRARPRSDESNRLWLKTGSCVW